MPVRGTFAEKAFRLAGSLVSCENSPWGADLVVCVIRTVPTAVGADRCWALLPGESLFALAWCARTWYTVAVGEAGGLVSCGLSNWS